MRLRWIFITMLTGLTLVACDGGSGSDPTPTPMPAMTVEEAAARGPFGVGLRTLDMVDETRPTEANREFAGSSSREMPVNVWYPVLPDTQDDEDEPVDTSGGPYPLIVFAHGYSSFRFQSASYARHLVSHGYVVAAPDFPQTRAETPGGPRMYAVLDQPGDVGFVIDELFEMDGDESSFLYEAIDEERVGVTGHSAGGLTSMITAYGPLRDERIDAVVPIAPVGCVLPQDIAEGVSVPAMIVGGSIDGLVGPVSIRDAYEAASAPKYFVSIIGAEHIRFGDFDLVDSEVGDVLGTTSRGDIEGDLIRFAQGIGGDAAACLEREDGTDALIEGEQQRALLRTVALPFFDAYLKNDQGALRFLDETLPTLEGIRFESELIDAEQEGD